MEVGDKKVNFKTFKQMATAPPKSGYSLMPNLSGAFESWSELTDEQMREEFDKIDADFGGSQNQKPNI